MLRGYDDYHGEDGAQHKGGNAHGQADEGEVASLSGGYFRSHHVPSSYCHAHLSSEQKEKKNEQTCCITRRLHEWEPDRPRITMYGSISLQRRLHVQEEADARNANSAVTHTVQLGPAPPCPVSSAQLRAS